MESVTLATIKQIAFIGIPTINREHNSEICFKTTCKLKKISNTQLFKIQPTKFYRLLKYDDCQTQNTNVVMCSYDGNEGNAKDGNACIDGTQALQLTASRSEESLKDERDGEPILHVVFVHPQIHWNTGNIGRTCLGLGARLHLVGPLGFSLDAKQVRRAGLDYWDYVDVRVYEDWSQFAGSTLSVLGDQNSRFFFSKFGTVSAAEVEWPSDGKIVLIFGSEVDGFDGIRKWLETQGHDETIVAFPMVDDRFRSFNLSTSASMALWDAYKYVRARLH